MADQTLVPGNLPMVMRRGVQFGTITVVMRDSNGAIINLTGYTPRWIARPEVPSPNVFDLGAALTGTPTDGKVVLLISGDDTQKNWLVGEYSHALTLETGGEPFGPYIEGPLTVEDHSARTGV